MLESITLMTDSAIWRSTLYPHEPNDKPRERLRAALLAFRERAAQLTTEIRKDLPALTVHDVSHLDSLWEMASTIAGPDYPFTPTEAFVLGGAILLHDTATSIISHPGGMTGILSDSRWKDYLTIEHRNRTGSDPTASELQNPAESTKEGALFMFLRQVHAENAERLIEMKFGERQIPLVDDIELRQTFGSLIGKLAHSHWWSLQELENEFSKTIGAPPWCPKEWVINPLKVAAILRLADAAHVDGRRAPLFLKSLTKMPHSSELHWRFQERINKPYTSDDSLVFTSTAAFQFNDAAAWWLCLDTLRMIDRELRGVDAMLTHAGIPRTIARRVAGVDNPEHLSKYVQVNGWFPVNATMQVSDLPRVIRHLGGNELYGNDPSVALRELLQNASDAVRARRAYESRSGDYGKILVSLTESDGNSYLEVTDNGIGMSRRVLTEFLLDFGRTFWTSSQMVEEFPGLIGSGLKTTGRYGIGFFSVFMLGDEIRVRTRRSDAALRDTLVLEFGEGPRGRPILRPAKREEQLVDGGTSVRIRLASPPKSKGGLLGEDRQDRINTLSTLTARIGPALDVDVFTREGESEDKTIELGDWVTMPGVELISRIGEWEDDSNQRLEYASVAAGMLREIRGSDGRLLGRASITPGFAGVRNQRGWPGGIVVVGGLAACGLSGICGVLVGEATRASRDSAVPLVSEPQLAAWATDQSRLVQTSKMTDHEKYGCAEYVGLCGGELSGLPIAYHPNTKRWLNQEEVENLVSRVNRVVVAKDYDCITADPETSFDENVIGTNFYSIPGLLQSNSRRDRWPRGLEAGFVWASGIDKGSPNFPLWRALLEAAANAWSMSVDDLLKTQRERVRLGTLGDRDFVVSGHVLSRRQPVQLH